MVDRFSRASLNRVMFVWVDGFQCNGFFSVFTDLGQLLQDRLSDVVPRRRFTTPGQRQHRACSGTGEIEISGLPARAGMLLSIFCTAYIYTFPIINTSTIGRRWVPRGE